MRVSLAATVVAGLVVFASAPPALAADVAIDGTRALPDRDTRTGQIRPAAAQRADARALGARVNWNRFGTPSSLVDPGGALATGVRGATPAAAARAWLDANAALFRLDSADGLELQSDNALAGGAGHAVTFRQVVGGLDAAGGGLVTIGLRARRRLARDLRRRQPARRLQPRRQAAARARAGGAEGRRERGRGALARADRAGRQARREGLRRLQAGRRPRRPVRQGRRVPDRRRRLGPRLRDDRPRQLRRGARGLPDLRRRAQRGDPGARERRRPRGRRPRSRRSTFSGELPAQDGGCDVLKGPYAVADGRRRPRDRRARRRVHAGAGHRAEAVPRHDARRPGRHGPHARADPLRARDRRPAGRLLRAGLRVRRRRPAGRAAHLLRHDHARHEHAAEAVHRALGHVRRHPAAQRPRRRPVGQPEHRHARGVVLEGEQHARATATTWSATWRRARRGTSTRSSTRPPTRRVGNNARVGRVVDRRQPAGRHPVPAHQPGAGLQLPVDERLEHGRLQPGLAVRRGVRAAARASTSRPPRRTCSSSTTGCTTGRTRSASPRTTGTRRPRTSA